MMKRMRCQNDVCVVYKAGLCIDVDPDEKLFQTPKDKKTLPRTGIWSYSNNGKIAKNDMDKEARNFAVAAEVLLMKYNNTLPKKHLCSDTRHTIGPLHTYKDASLAKRAIQMF